MRAILLALLLAGCNASQPVTTILPNADLSDVDVTGHSDGSVASSVDMTGIVAAGDMAHAQPVDFSMQPPPVIDMAFCPVVPACGPPSGQLGCCNGAATCIDSKCQNLPGQPCNIDSTKGPIVSCFTGSNNAPPSGQCGADNKCAP